MANSLVDDNFIQYKCKEYKVGEYFQKYSDKLDIGRIITCIKPVNPYSYTPFSLSIESTIQRLSELDVPDYSDKEHLNSFSLKLTENYGFLYLAKHLDTLNDDIETHNYATMFDGSPEKYIKDNPYDGEVIHEWANLVKTVQYTLNRIDDNSYKDSIDSLDNFDYENRLSNYLSEVSPVFDFNKQNISLKCQSLASAIILSIVSNNKHLKSCNVCSKLFFSKRSDTKYCCTTCGRKKQGDRKLKPK